ncbi:MAG: Hsp70 family protein [Myxococcota bacterium]|nr:Hsp70 family protein [Myxococcota bacterium]
MDRTGQVVVLADQMGYKIHPSVVSFHPNGGVIVGAAAKQRKVIDPQNTIYSAKRLIGRSFHSAEVQIARSRVPYPIKEGEQGPVISTRAGDFAVPEISAIILDHVRTVATGRLGTDVKRAVVTVPASFNDAQRSATATAGSIAGLEVVRVLNEPTAAALAYGHTRNLHEIIAVYDFGGGTFDITILKLADQVYEVLGTAGDTFLGGDDLDERLVDRMVAKFLAENRLDLRTNEVAMMRLRAVAEQTKIELSRRARAVVKVDEIAYGAKGVALDLQIEISRDEMVRQTADIIDRTFPVCEEALKLAGLGIDAIADVILVGGTTKIPYVRDQVARFFGKAARNDVNPEDAVAVGAALQAKALERTLAKRGAGTGSVARVARHELDEEPTVDGSVTQVQAMADEAVGGATMAPSELMGAAPKVKRPTAGYATTRDDKADTSYKVTRGGARDVFTQRPPTIPPSTTRAGTQPIGTQPNVPLARMTKPATPPPSKTLYGVPVVAPGATPPPTPPPRLQAGHDPALRRPPSPRPLTEDTLAGETDTFSGLTDDHDTTFVAEAATRPSGHSPASAPPSAPPASARAPVASPNAATMIAVAPTLAMPAQARSSSDFDDEDRVPTASTAKGFQAPQTYPVMPMAPVAPQAPAPTLLEVTPRGLGIGTVAGFCEELIQRNSRLPAAIKKSFTTSRDLQQHVRIVVVQGESRRLDSNTVIGDLLLHDLPARPRGETSIEVTFSLDASGILQVRARDAQTGNEQSASLDLVGGMQQQDVAVSRDRLAALRR